MYYRVFRIPAPESTDALPALSPLKSVTVEEGAPASFTTHVTAKQKPTIQWYREGALIPQSADFKVVLASSTFVFYSKNSFVT